MQYFVVLRPSARRTASLPGWTGWECNRNGSSDLAVASIRERRGEREEFLPCQPISMENFVWISDQRCDTNSRPLGNFLCALWPSGDARDDCVKPILERIGNSGVMVGNVVEDNHQGRQSPRWHRPLSCRAEFLENLLDLIIGSEATLARGLQAPIDSLKFGVA
jgi:hypothetical protein